jgi:hypothetical protein
MTNHWFDADRNFPDGDPRAEQAIRSIRAAGFVILSSFVPRT